MRNAERGCKPARRKAGRHLGDRGRKGRRRRRHIVQAKLALLRAAAKNCRDVVVVCSPARYGIVLEDADCALAAPWRLPGVAATFVVDAGGRVQMRRIGALRAADLDTWVRPLLKELGV